ncbi:metallopeptidase TldD-related protein [Streptomyces sp. NPDC001307]|uniref:metallopeptidase TldD-related protein n=1 Tax=Streptomyces sp. NPDC001307 TaxID=3364560 RepID=UPI0036D0AF6D
MIPDAAALLADCPDDVEIYAESYRSEVLHLTDRGFDTTATTTAGAAVRCFRRGAVGFCATHDLGPTGIARAVAAAARAAETVVPNDAELPADPRPTPDFVAGPRLADVRPADLGEALTAVRTALTDRRGAPCTPVTLTAELGRRRTVICNGTGLARAFEEAYVHVSVSALVPDEGGHGMGQASWWGRDLAGLPVHDMAGQLVTDGRARRASSSRRLRGEPLLVTAPVAARLLAQCAALFVSPADPGPADRSSPAVTVEDDPTAVDVVGAAPFDGEGIVTARKTLIDSGRRVGRLGDHHLSRRTGDPLASGNVQRTAYTQWPAVGVSVLTLRPADAPRDALLKAAGDGLLVQGVRGLSAGEGRLSAELLGVPLHQGEPAGPAVRVPLTTTPGALLGSIEQLGTAVHRHGPVGAPDLLLDGARLAAAHRRPISSHQGEQS